MEVKKPDFSGYVTKNDLKCTDGRIIRKDAFKHCDGKVVPLVWQHMHTDPDNVLGRIRLENRTDGVYGYGYFNNTPKAKNAKELVVHEDITSMSIWANELSQSGPDVLHGDIKEVSLVLAGANPGARIDNIAIAHADGSEYIDDTEAIISSGFTFDKEEKEEPKVEDESEEIKHADSSNETLGDIFNTLTDKQKEAVYAMIAQVASGERIEQSDDLEEGGNYMKHNVFEGTDRVESENRPVLTHSQIKEIFEDAQRCGSLKESVLAHAQSYGIKNIEYLFPDAKTVTQTPDFIKRNTEWVQRVLNGAKHSPFSRIKSTAADITADEARAKGYVKGNLKKEEVIKLLKRITTPTTIYKKQKLDRDDIIDITDFNVVTWLKSEMRLMLNEELARAVLVGDGREAEDDDKINEENIRPIWTDNDMYAIHVTIDSTVDNEGEMEAILRAMDDYEGTGSPVLFTTQSKLTDYLLLKDKVGRRYYTTKAEVAAALGVSDIVTVPVMKGLSRTLSDETTNVDLLGIIVNMGDYNIGADKGGELSMFDDFDIDYNQYKYLMETRCSGALIHPHSAVVVEKKKTA